MIIHHRFKNQLFCLIIILILSLFVSTTASAYNFYNVRSKLVSGLSKTKIKTSGRRLAVVYRIEDRSRVKQSHNLVELKKELSFELLKSFSVVDPIITNEILRTNHLSYEELLTSRSLLKQFSDRAESDQILFVSLAPMGDGDLVARFKLLNSNSDQITGLETRIASEKTPKQTYKVAKVVGQSKDAADTVLQSFITDFVPKSFMSGQNDSWIHFQPTALIIPETYAIETQLWIRNPAEVDIRPTRVRFDMKLLEGVQGGAQLYATNPVTNASNGIHSFYISGKYLISDQFAMPVNLAIGLRKRLFFNPSNNDYTAGDAAINAKNSRYNATTLQLMVTGQMESLGLLYNVYLDNMELTAGAKFLLTPEVKLFLDQTFYYHRNPLVSADTAIGVQLYNVAGYASLAYELSTSQILLGFSFDF